jgi:hypothetical protein
MKNSRSFRALKLDTSCVVTLLIAGLLLVTSVPVTAQVPVLLMQPPRPQYFDTVGLPLAFGCVFTYQVGSTTPLPTYTDRTGGVQNANPVILDASGGLASSIWIQAGQAYTVKVMSSGGTNCASGSTLYTVDGIGGGVTTLTTNVTYSATPTFQDASQNQLFTITLTGNAVSQPLTAVGVVPPGLVSWQITQDAFGGHTFAWPANTVGAATICPTGNCVTQQTFLWNGTNATATGPATYSTPAMAVPNFFDFGLTANSAVCVSSTFELITGASCNTPLGITFNGQTVQPGASGNVNPGAAAHSVALNQGNGNAITGLTLGANEIPMGAAGADPVNKLVPTCSSVQAETFNGTSWSCITPTPIVSTIVKTLGAPVAIVSGTTVLTQAVTMPASGCPCRALVNWYANADTTNSGDMAVTINDGTNNFATGATSTPGSASDFSIGGSGISIGTYANNAAITFTMKGTTTMAGGPNIHVANAAGLGQGTYMQISILSSN